jgi:putative membrane protein
MRIRSTAAFLFAATLAFAAYAEEPQRMAATSADKDVAKFLEKVASADQLEIESGRLAAQKASDPQLKAFGQKMASDHSQADQELRALALRKGVTLPIAMSDSHQKKLDKLREEKAGKDFDAGFRDLMIDSHKEAIGLFEDTAKDAKDPEVKAFAARMLPKIQQHEQAAKALPKG